MIECNLGTVPVAIQKSRVGESCRHAMSLSAYYYFLIKKMIHSDKTGVVSILSLWRTYNTHSKKVGYTHCSFSGSFNRACNVSLKRKKLWTVKVGFMQSRGGHSDYC